MRLSGQFLLLFLFYEKILSIKTQTKASKLTFNQIFPSKKHKQKHLSNIQPDIKKKIKDCPKHPSNFHPDNMQNFYLDNTPRSIKSKFYLHFYKF